MGNCCCAGAPVDNHHSPVNTKPPSPATKQRIINNYNNNNPTENKGKGIIVNDDKEEKPPSPSPIRNEKTIITPNLKAFTFGELKSATRNFRPDTMLGEGGFGRVFKGWVDENTYAPSKVGLGIAVAVKKANSDSPQGLQEWQAEVNFLGKFTHPNLVKLLGYCWEDKEFLLVYEYMQKGSLENHLFKKGPEPLSWGTRIKIAIGAARGLAFLHTSEKKVIYRDFKSSNILLDGLLIGSEEEWLLINEEPSGVLLFNGEILCFQNYNAKLSDFGLAKLGPSNGNSHVTTRIMGTYGYAAPEYVATGHLYVKSDVYGFGVVLLEMLTGLVALDTTRPGGETNLVEWAKPFMKEKRKLRKIMDSKLEENYPLKAAWQAAELVQKCLEPDPKTRPSMEEVLIILERIDSIKERPKETPKASPLHSKSPRQEYRSPHHQRQYNSHNNYNHRSPLHSKHDGDRKVVSSDGGGQAHQWPFTAKSY